MGYCAYGRAADEDAHVATRGDVNYMPLADPLWWTISNLLFLYTSAVQQGANARNLRLNQERCPELIGLVQEAGLSRIGFVTEAAPPK